MADVIDFKIHGDDMQIVEVEIDCSTPSVTVENVPIPTSGLPFEGEDESQFIDDKGVKMRWSCKPE